MIILKQIFIILLSVLSLYAQAKIDFENTGWNSNQRIGDYFEVDGFTMYSNGYFYTNYGRGFDVYGLSVYFVWEDEDTKMITMTTEQNGTITFKSFASYQVSETVIDYTLTVEGWYDNDLRYTKSFTDINQWDILDLNFENVNKILIKFDAVNPFDLIDFNFDDFYFIYGKRQVKALLQ